MVKGIDARPRELGKGHRNSGFGDLLLVASSNFIAEDRLSHFMNE